MSTPRVFVDLDLAAGSTITLAAAQAHYLRNVMRLATGDAVRVFNGRNGEWQAEIALAGRSGIALTPRKQVRVQHVENGPIVLFAPIRKERLHILVEKATELGATRLQPVITVRTDKARVPPDRLLQHSIEAAEQCERLTVPEVAPPLALPAALAAWPESRTLLFLDEASGGTPVGETILSLAAKGNAAPLGILVGPEGGFTPAEAEHLRARSFVLPVSLGPRILRTETAVIAALACWQAFAGDWRAAAAPNRGT